jgi:nitrite reductase/ring-hydroxylating ferredoxin subunit
MTTHRPLHASRPRLAAFLHEDLVLACPAHVARFDADGREVLTPDQLLARLRDRAATRAETFGAARAGGKPPR